MRLLIFCCLLPFLTACKTLHSQWPATSGEISSQSRAVSGAYVVALWKGFESAPTRSKGRSNAESQNVCYHLETQRSSKKGRFKIKPWNKPDQLVHIRHQSFELIAYKPGYEFKQITNPTSNNKALLRLNKLNYKKAGFNNRERLKQLQRLVAQTSCQLNNKARRKLAKMYKAIVREGQGIAKSQAEKQLLASLIRWTRFVSN